MPKLPTMMRDQTRDFVMQTKSPTSSPSRPTSNGQHSPSNSGKHMAKAAYCHRFLAVTLLVLAVLTMMSSHRHMVAPPLEPTRYLSSRLLNRLHNNGTQDHNNTLNSTDREIIIPPPPRDINLDFNNPKLNLSGFPNDNDKLPGKFMEDKLYLLGTRLTTSHDKFDQSVSFDLFAHAVGGGAASGFYDISKLDTQGGFNYASASRFQFWCHLHEPGQEHYRGAPTNLYAHDKSNNVNIKPQLIAMEYIPTYSIDKNTWNSHLIWRCNLSPHISKAQLLEEDRTHVRVSVFPMKNRAHRNTSLPLLTVDVPLDTASVGFGGPLVKSSNTPSFLQKIARDGPYGVILCCAGIKKSAMWILPEWIQHHLNVGVDHFFLGADSPHEMEYLKKKLKYYIDRGIVVLGGEDVVMPEREIRKMRFYNQCLYHAKGMSEYVVNWDIDELWMPPIKRNMSTNYFHIAGTNHSHMSKHYERRQSRGEALSSKEDELLSQSPYHSTMSLIEAVRSLQGKNGCSDWCYQTFPSYTIVRVDKKKENATHPQLQGYYGFPVREAKLNYQWQKPIIRTKYAYQASFHIGGSCSRGNTHTMVDNEKGETVYQRMFNDCPLVRDERDDTLGRMHHYLALFRKNWGTVKLNEYPNRDEYTYLFRRTVVKQLEALKGKVKAE